MNRESICFDLAMRVNACTISDIAETVGIILQLTILDMSDLLILQDLATSEIVTL